MPLDYFSVDKEDTRLIRCDNKVYKVKVLPKSSFDPPCDKKAAHDQIESVLRSLLYLDQRCVVLKPIHTQHFIVTAVKKAWKTCRSLQFYLHGKPIKACPYQFILKVDLKYVPSNEVISGSQANKNISHDQVKNVSCDQSTVSSSDRNKISRPRSNDNVDNRQIVEVYKQTQKSKAVDLEGSQDEIKNNKSPENEKEVERGRLLEKIRKRERQKEEEVKRKKEVENLFKKSSVSPSKKVRKLYTTQVYCKTPSSTLSSGLKRTRKSKCTNELLSPRIKKGLRSEKLFSEDKLKEQNDVNQKNASPKKSNKTDVQEKVDIDMKSANVDGQQDDEGGNTEPVQTRAHSRVRESLHNTKRPNEGSSPRKNSQKVQMKGKTSNKVINTSVPGKLLKAKRNGNSVTRSSITTRSGSVKSTGQHVLQNRRNKRLKNVGGSSLNTKKQGSEKNLQGRKSTRKKVAPGKRAKIVARKSNPIYKKAKLVDDSDLKELHGPDDRLPIQQPNRRRKLRSETESDCRSGKQLKVGNNDCSVPIKGSKKLSNSSTMSLSDSESQISDRSARIRRAFKISNNDTPSVGQNDKAHTQRETDRLQKLQLPQNKRAKLRSNSSSSDSKMSLRSDRLKKTTGIRSKSLSPRKTKKSSYLVNNAKTKVSPKIDLFRPVRSDVHESQRLQKLRNTSSGQSRKISRQPLDRHLIETEEIEESVKLQTLSKPKTPPVELRKSPRKRKPSGFWEFIDNNLITPVKKVFKK